MECVRRTSRVTSLRYRAVAPGLSPLAGWRGWLWWACARTHTQHCGGGSRGPRTTTVSLREVVSRQQSVPNPQSRRISSHTDSASRSDHIPKPSHKPSTMFKNHLDMIGRNEPVSKKAKFWQSYVRSLKGSDDIRASDTTHRTPRGIFRPLSDFPELHSTTWPYGKSIYDDPIHASDRISVPGYRYNPIHRETYGYSPRAIYPHQYASLDRYRPVFHVTKSKPYDVDKAWQDHLDRIAKTHSEFPDAYPFSRYPLYLVYHSHPRIDRRPAAPYSPYRDMLDHLDRLAGLDKLSPLDPYDPYYRGLSPTPIKAGEFGPRPNEVAFNYAGLPIYTRGGLAGRILRDLLNPRSSLPLSAITRDPWWWKYPEFRPFNAPYDSWGKSPFFLRDSYLSPVKRTYLWDKHPIRPFAHVY